MSTAPSVAVPVTEIPQPTEADSTTTKDKAKVLADKAKKKKREKAKKKAKRASRKNVLKTKVIVRRLPPNLPEEIFMNTVKPWTSEENVDYKYYVLGKLSKSKAKEHVFSRAYFHFKTMEAVIAFHQGFDGHIFVDSRGNESRAVVEFAPYQKIPKEQKTTDARAGTIDSDPDYYKFLLMLKAEENKSPEVKKGSDGLSQIERLENRLALVSAQTIAAEQANKPKTTPLLEHLRAQKAAKDSAKAKLQAQKNASRNTAKKSAATSSSAGSTPTQNGSQGGQGGAQTSADAKKPGRRERGKKKKDDKKPNGTAEKSGNSNDKQSSSERRNNNGSGKTAGNQSEKTGNGNGNGGGGGGGGGGGDKPPGTGRSREGRSRRKPAATNGGQPEKQPVIKVLNRQSGEDKTKSGNNSSPTPKRSG
ncbi:Smg-4/UPF3 family-domain-containing protein [Phycomyces blakesleeanus]